jgi:hypothetical protein
MKSLPWLAAFAFVLHTVFGTAEVHAPLLNSPLPLDVSLLLYACWHIVTVVLLGSFVVLFVAVHLRRSASWVVAARFVGALWIAFGLVFVSVSLVFSGPAMLLILGQWILLIPIGSLALFGAYERKLREDEKAEPGATDNPGDAQ